MVKKKDIKDWHLAALADFLMRQGETGTEVQKGRFNVKNTVENFIDIEEWIDIFTEDKANWTALKRLIEHEYPKDSDKKDVLALVARYAATSSRALPVASVKDGDEEVEALRTRKLLGSLREDSEQQP